VETKRATPREEFGKPEAGQTVKKVFVGGLKEDMTEDDIREYFEQFGKITAITRLTEKDTGKPRGFGFVEFDDYDPVDKAILKGSHQIQGKRVDVKKAISKQEMNSMGGGGGPGGMRGGAGGGRRVSFLHFFYAILQSKTLLFFKFSGPKFCPSDQNILASRYCIGEILAKKSRFVRIANISLILGFTLDVFAVEVYAKVKIQSSELRFCFKFG